MPRPPALAALDVEMARTLHVARDRAGCGFGAGRGAKYARIKQSIKMRNEATQVIESKGTCPGTNPNKATKAVVSGK
jgi:hypothetical protein